MGEYKEIAAKLKEADAILIGASNGFSISEGLHIFADNQAFEEVFGDFKRAYGIRNILSGIFADWPSEEVKWAFLSRLIHHYSIGYTGGRDIEVFLLGGRIMEDAICECGYVIEAQEAILKVTDRKKEG